MTAAYNNKKKKKDKTTPIGIKKGSDYWYAEYAHINERLITTPTLLLFYKKGL